MSIPKRTRQTPGAQSQRKARAEGRIEGWKKKFPHSPILHYEYIYRGFIIQLFIAKKMCMHNEVWGCAEFFSEGCFDQLHFIVNIVNSLNFLKFSSDEKTESLTNIWEPAVPLG